MCELLLESKKLDIKFYDLDIDNYIKPAMPKGAFVASPFGLGLSRQKNRFDYYFCHPNMEEVSNFFNLPAPTLSELSAIDGNNEVLKVFGLAYDPQTLRPIKLKRYYYPQDPYLNYILFDEELAHV